MHISTTVYIEGGNAEVRAFMSGHPHLTADPFADLRFRTEGADVAVRTRSVAEAIALRDAAQELVDVWEAAQVPA